MRFVVVCASLIAAAYAVPAIVSEERITAILEKLRRAQSIGELAVNTPTGIYPIKDINRQNLRQIFNFAPLSPKQQLEHDLKAEAEANIDSEATKAEKDVAPNQEKKPDEEKATVDETEAKPSTEEAAAKETATEPTETNNKIEEGSLTDPPTIAPAISAIEKDDEGVIEAEAEPVEATKSAEIEGSGDAHQAVEGSGDADENVSSSSPDQTLLTDTDSTSTGNELPTDTNKKPLPTITLPHQPDTPYVFVPVQQIKDKQLPGASYLLIPKKYEDKVPEYLTAKARM
ncbi:unnamed protein product [Nippostrongylus brasiliensis]|uniref:Secreted protein n=1 Tax=Nippostrongylus brasiliensis TaxID=27835 RepID=A0A0N4XZ11_NIPBR|nr:unnamed protein product [Nippostrongylus brasiliensis]